MGNPRTLLGRASIAHKENTSFRERKISRIHKSFSCKRRWLLLQFFLGAFHHYMDARRTHIEAPESLCSSSSRTRDVVDPGIQVNPSSIWAHRSSTRVNPPSVSGGPNTRLNPLSIWVDPYIRVGCW